MNQTKNQIKSDLALDLFHLDTEVQRQAQLYLHYSEQASDARKERDTAALKLDTRTAEIELALRANPPGGKITEGGIKAHLDADPELKDLRAAVIEANYGLSLLEGVVRGLDHKKSQLDNAVRLWSAGYYQDPGRGALADNGNSSQRTSLNSNPRLSNKEG